MEVVEVLKKIHSVAEAFGLETGAIIGLIRLKNSRKESGIAPHSCHKFSR